MRTNISKINYIVKTGLTVQRYDNKGSTNGEYGSDGDYKKGFNRDNTRNDALGIVSDNIYKVIWQDNIVVSDRNFTQASDYCNNLNIDKYSKWRMPTMIELSNLINYKDTNILSIFENKENKEYWTSTNKDNNTSSTSAYSVNFYNTKITAMPKNYNKNVRCIHEF
jgi:hypothetical protein